MSRHSLPPLRHLPQWTRVGRLGQPRSSCRSSATQPSAVDVGAGRDAEVSCHGDMDPRVASLQRNIQFLQQQHKNTLEKLHAEIEYLRRENKELQYKLIMEPLKSSRKGMACTQRGIRPRSQENDPRTGLYLEQSLHNKWASQDQAPRCIAYPKMTTKQEQMTCCTEESSKSLGSARQDRGSEVKGGLITSLQPLRIQSSPFHPPHAPTLQECEVVIRQLYNATSLQSQEIVRVKALLRDIVLSKKITLENCILTKAYLVDGTRKSAEEKKLPKLGLQTFPEKMSGPHQAGVVLPPLKQSLSSTIAERQRRTRAVQRNRFKRMVQ